MFQKKPSKTSRLNKVAIAVTMGALSLTGCGVASTAGAAAPSSGQAARSAAAPAAVASPKAAALPRVAASPKAAATPRATATPKATATGTAVVPDELDTAPIGRTAGTAAAPAAAEAAPVAAVEPAAEGTAAAEAATGTSPAVAAPGPAPVSAQAAIAATGNGSQAATARGWGAVVAGDEFSNTGAPDSTKWSVFKGTGHAGKGVRSPQAWSVANGVATVSGNSAGTTGGMSAKFAQQKYGKWETRMRTNARDPKYHPVLILWPNNNTSPNCAEIDYAEGSTNTAQIKFFLHYACGGSGFQTDRGQDHRHHAVAQLRRGVDSGWSHRLHRRRQDLLRHEPGAPAHSRHAPDAAAGLVPGRLGH